MRVFVKFILITILGLLFIVVMAYKKIAIPGIATQMSLQSLSISLLVIMLERRAFLVVLIYLILATIGLPVLAGGTSNSSWFFTPSAGYYFGFLISSFTLARILRNVKPHTFSQTWLCFSSNESIILFCGFLTLSFSMGPNKAFLVGIWPYLIGAALKITTATCCYQLRLFGKKVFNPSSAI